MTARARARRHLLRLLPAVAGALALSAPATALAEGLEAGLFLDAFASLGGIRESTLHVAPLLTEPDPLKARALRLDGPGSFYGGGMHIVLFGSAVRGGLGVGMFGMEGVELRHEPLPDGLSTSLGTSWGASFDVFIGREFMDGPVYPYVDLRAVLNVLQAGVVLHHPGYGVLGETAYNAYAFGVGPRLGVSIPLCDPWAIDLAGYYGLFGGERATLVASFGVWSR